MAAVDYFLKIDGIAGESADAKHKGAIDIESFGWGETSAGSHGAGGGGGAGKVEIQDLHATTKTSKASPLLLVACASGKHIKEAVLTVRKAGKTQADFLTIRLGDVLISGYQIAGHGEALPLDQLSLSFARLEVEYRTQKPDGSLDTPVKGGWDAKAGKKV